MLCSDHFVRMYNELFKMLADRGEGDLQQYWKEIAALQMTILGPYIESDGLLGMFHYWDHIRIEENCDMELFLEEDWFGIDMHGCPSLSKNLDNDAGLCLHYCEHCAGWINPVLRSYGYWPVYDMISPTEPRCKVRICKDKAKALQFADEARYLWDPYNDLK
ncbi:MAG: hypothetical protein CVV52_02775 [Spirochaetae bacterium HGW-Spirochaetae-8]|jgi:hypothetical protein|nr:MAG: hypothetical protein CVV52_02775 [Spirochaetae bacterium HGW-Spirochaetae-8]